MPEFRMPPQHENKAMDKPNIKETTIIINDGKVVNTIPESKGGKY